MGGEFRSTVAGRATRAVSFRIRWCADHPYLYDSVPRLNFIGSVNPIFHV